MNFFKRIKGAFLALLPIIAIVLFVHFFLFKFDTQILVNFLIAIVIAGIGESLLFGGIDSTIMPMGELMVQSVTKVSRFVVFIVFAIIFGTFATIAEPDVSIFTREVVNSGINISRTILTFFIGAGTGIFIALGIFRIIKKLNIKYIYLIMFAIIFLICTQVSDEYIALAFDAGGATTGIITAPFLLAISNGISNKFKKENSGEIFGMVGIASLGPVIFTLLVFIFFNNQGVDANSFVASENLNIYLSVLKQTTLSVIPLSLVFFVYDLILIKLPISKKLSLLIGVVETFLGMLLFLFSIDFGISSMGRQIGQFIQTLSIPTVILFCSIIGFVITFCEPSIIVLSKQVQSATKGNISSVVVTLSIAFSMALAVLITALKIIYNINFFYIIFACYLIAIILMFFVPSMFTGLAFDSGGAASGPMTSALLLPIMIQLASGSSAALSGFGIIGIVSVSPIMVVQLLGFVYRVELDKKDYIDKKNAIKVSYTAEIYSNIDKLEAEYKFLMRNKRVK